MKTSMQLRVPTMMKIFVQSHVPAPLIPLLRTFYYSIRALPYLGHGVICPCCQHHLRCFLPFDKRQNALCPFCSALERHRLLWLYLNNRTNLFHDRLKVLHFAPEKAFEKKLRSSLNLEYLTADMNNVAMVKADITAIPFADGAFDVILCSHVLEHVPDDRKAMSELYRVLKPGGWAILLVPLDVDRAITFEDPSVVDPKERERLFGQYDHVRIYGWDYVDRLEQAGFTVSQDFYARDLASAVIQRHGLPKDVVIFYCTKPASVEGATGFQTDRPVDPTKSEECQTGQVPHMEVDAKKR